MHELDTAWVVMYSLTATAGTTAIGMILYGSWNSITNLFRKRVKS